jgi:uncharacterized membrane protein YfcA
MPAGELIVLALVAVVGSAAQSATGFGFALPLAPVAFAFLSPPDAVLAVAAAAVMHNALVLTTRRRRLEIRGPDAALVIAAALPGLLLGAVIVSRVSKPPMQLAVGAAILLAVGLRLHEPGRLAAFARRRAGVPIGLLAGTLTTTVGINGPPIVIWLRARRVTLVQLRDTLALVFLAMNAAAVPSLIAGEGSIPAELPAALAAGLLAGHVLGVEAHRRFATETLDKVLVAILVVAGTGSILAGLL